MSSEEELKPDDRGGSGAASGRDGRPGSIEERELTDPKTMRALAHPVRMALLELLSVNDTLTATQASELLGESPANCAFHLRTLAKYGFAEETGGGRGRERPWRAPHIRLHIEAAKLDSQASIAANTLSTAWLERAFERAKHAMRHGAPMPEGWEHTATSTQAAPYLTRNELKQLSNDVLELLSRYDDRRDKNKRPDGAQPVELLFLGYPITGLSVSKDEE